MSINRRAVLTAALAGFLTLPLPRRALAAGEVERVDDLIARMTIEEKAGQMTCLADSFRPYNPPNPQVGIRNERQLADEIRKGRVGCLFNGIGVRSEEHTSELQSLMRISYAVFCFKKKKENNNTT